MEALRNVVGGRATTALAGLGIASVEDLLAHYPRRYVERGELTDLGGLAIGQEVTVLARVASASSRRLGPGGGRRPRDILEVEVTDGTGRLTLTFFNQSWRAKELVAGRQGLFAGSVGSFRGRRQLLNPDYQLIGEEEVDQAAQAYAGRLIPVYPASSKMPTWRIASCIAMALPLSAGEPDPLDDELRRRAGVIDRPTALQWIHQPQDRAQVRRARERLRWDEAFGVQVVLAQRRAATTAAMAVPRPGRAGGLLDAFDAALPFDLTTGQRQVGQVLAAEIAGEHPMHRLLQGEVGSGKTVVALRAMLQVVDSGGQAALLAPTEVLAGQHARSLSRLLGPLAEGGMLGGSVEATRVALITGSLGTAARRTALLDVAGGAAGIVVGTHALLEERVQFADLGMVVIDEQHRFGVEQRAALVGKTGVARRPHALVMTATPIPRTVAMTVFGDLEVSTLRELPTGRVPVTTHLVPALERPDYLARAWERAREEVAAGRQAYVVCPRIDEATPEADGAQDDRPEGDDGGHPPASVEGLLPHLVGGPLAGLRLAALTGRMAAGDKDDVMARFADPTGSDGIDVLVSTTVVEVGVDVPNATLMIVMDADRFGVSQLHQLRGRVGRGRHAGLCLLVTSAPVGSPARERLDAVAGTSDGFELATYDLRARREGDVLGAAQSGSRRSLRLLSVLDHEDVILRARGEASRLIDEDPGLSGHPVLAEHISRLFDQEHAEYLDKA